MIVLPISAYTIVNQSIHFVNNSGLDKDICIKFYVKMHHSHAEMTT